MAEPAFSQSSAAERQVFPAQQKSFGFWLWVGLAGALAIMLVTRGVWQEPGAVPGDEHPAVGHKLTRFALEPLTGDARRIELADLAGKVTLVNFWGPWCGACAIEFPHLVEIEKHFRHNATFQFLSVSSNFDPLDEAGLAESTADFLKRHAADFPTYRDPRAETTRAMIAELGLENFGYPTTVLIGPDQKVSALWTGYTPGDEKRLLQAIEKALSKGL